MYCVDRHRGIGARVAVRPRVCPKESRLPISPPSNTQKHANAVGAWPLSGVRTTPRWNVACFFCRCTVGRVCAPKYPRQHAYVGGTSDSALGHIKTSWGTHLKLPVSTLHEQPPLKLTVLGHFLAKFGARLMYREATTASATMRSSPCSLVNHNTFFPIARELSERVN